MSAMNIYRITPITDKIINSFRPTRLYIKELAGVKYFGKTTAEDAFKYPGSGKIWDARKKKYGRKNIKTTWVSDWFYCPYHIQQFALMFSELNQIVESEEWDNLMPEDGLWGGRGATGYKHSAKALSKISEPWSEERKAAWTGRTLSEEHCRAIGDGNRGKEKSAKHCANISAGKKDKPSPNKGKAYEEIYGIEKASAMKEVRKSESSVERGTKMGKGNKGKNSPHKGKTYEEIYGKERSKEIRELRKIPSKNKGKTYEELYGIEEAKRMREERGRTQKERQAKRKITK